MKSISTAADTVVTSESSTSNTMKSKANLNTTKYPDSKWQRGQRSNDPIKLGDHNSKELEDIEEDSQERKSNDSAKSNRRENQPGIEEVKSRSEDTKLQQLYERFDKDPVFETSTKDFIKKLEVHFKSKQKKIVEWTSFVNAVHNLFTQHIGKVANKNKHSNI